MVLFFYLWKNSLKEMKVRAKKGLGQHFLKEKRVAERIIDATLEGMEAFSKNSEAFSKSNGTFAEGNDAVVAKAGGLLPLLEVGPGTGVLTSILLNRELEQFKMVEIDDESIQFLRGLYPNLGSDLIEGDFLQLNLEQLFEGQFAVIGNFPYNISSQIFFKILEHQQQVPLIVGMLQREVAVRLAASPGGKEYGILSVLLQAWYNIEYLFTVDESAFIPPPKVKSGVIRLTYNGREELGCDSKLFKRVVKATFNHRRKTIRNSLKSLYFSLTGDKDVMTKIDTLPSHFLQERPERLSVEQFIELTNLIAESL